MEILTLVYQFFSCGKSMYQESYAGTVLLTLEILNRVAEVNGLRSNFHCVSFSGWDATTFNWYTNAVRMRGKTVPVPH